MLLNIYVAINFNTTNVDLFPSRVGATGVDYSISAVTDNVAAQLTKINNRTFFDASIGNTLSFPTKVPELLNIERLNSSNLVLPGNVRLPPRVFNQRVNSGILSNTVGMSLCISNKMDDLMGIFNVDINVTLPVPVIPEIVIDIPGGVIVIDPRNLDVVEALKALVNNIKNGAKGLINGIKDAFTNKKQNLLDQLEAGLLNLKKFRVCIDLQADFTPRQRKLALANPGILDQIKLDNVRLGQDILRDQTIFNVNNRTIPLVNRTKQELVGGLTSVANIEKIPLNLSNRIRINNGQ